MLRVSEDDFGANMDANILHVQVADSIDSCDVFGGVQ